jgi:hypothetical protein
VELAFVLTHGISDGMLISRRAQVDDERTTEVGLYHYAESYRSCAERLETGPPEHLMFEAPIEFLFYHALELYMKAYLRSAGLTVDDLRARKFGHQLQALWTECCNRGLALGGYPDAFFDFLDPSEVMATRYISTGFYRKPSMGALHEVTQQVRNLVRDALMSQGKAIRG